MRKVLIISDFAYPILGGTERHVWGLSRYLTEKGYKVHILTPRWGNQESHLELGGIHIHRIGLPLWKVGVLRSLYYLFYGLKLDREEGFDVIHGFYMVPPLLSAIWTGKLRKKKTVVTLFEPEPLDENLKNPLFGAVLKETLSRAEVITTLNEELERKVRDLFPSKRVITIPNWVEEHFRPRAVSKSRNGKLILFVGRLCEQKGADVLIKAMPIILRDVRAKAVFIGPSWEKERFERLAAELGVLQDIEIKGFVDEDELVEWYNRADLLVYPTVKKGGFGFTIIEAMACGTPVVGSDDMGVPYAIGDGGLVTRRGDAVDLASGILKVLTDVDLYKRFRECGLRRAVELFGRRTVLEKYLRAYDEVAMSP